MVFKNILRNDLTNYVYKTHIAAVYNANYEVETLVSAMKNAIESVASNLDVP